MAKTKKEKKSKKRKLEKKKKTKKPKKIEKQRKIEPGDLQTREEESQDTKDVNYAIPLGLMCSKSHAPETPQEYLKRQNQIRHETDPITGRQRLVKGDGEILEEIVSRDRHLQINKQATQGDGLFFQKNTTGTKGKGC